MHDHAHHNHAPKQGNTRAFLWGLGMNIALVVAELVCGFLFESLALIADAVHNISDVVGLLLAFSAELLLRRLPTSRRTYGYHKATILAALFGAILLLVAMGGMIWEAIERLSSPQPLLALPVIAVAAIALVVNALTAYLFHAGGKKDLNIRAAFLHMAADAAVSLGVILSGIGILLTGWMWLDPIASLLIAVTVVLSTWSLFRESLALALDSVPAGIDPSAVHEYLLSLEEVTDLHDLHIWGISTRETALTVHLVMPNHNSDDQFLHMLTTELNQRFGVGHITVQIEQQEHGEGCPLQACQQAYH